MTMLRLQVIHKHLSGLPRDNFVNTFHVQQIGTAGITLGDIEDIAEAVRDFYVVAPGGVGETMSEQFSDVVATTGHEVRAYLMEEDTGLRTGAEGDPPEHTEVFDHLGRNAAGSRTGYPSEVAACLSYKNTTIGGVPARRRRGRIYIGPLYQGFGVEGTFQRPSIMAATRTFMIDVAQELVTRLAATGAGYEWGIFSRPYEGRDAIPRETRPDLPAIPPRGGAFYPINEFWVDDAFDTQRRRGERPVSRTTGAA